MKFKAKQLILWIVMSLLVTNAYAEGTLEEPIKLEFEGSRFFATGIITDTAYCNDSYFYVVAPEDGAIDDIPFQFEATASLYDKADYAWTGIFNHARVAKGDTIYIKAQNCTWDTTYIKIQFVGRSRETAISEAYQTKQLTRRSTINVEDTLWRYFSIPAGDSLFLYPVDATEQNSFSYSLGTTGDILTSGEGIGVLFAEGDTLFYKMKYNGKYVKTAYFNSKTDYLAGRPIEIFMGKTLFPPAAVGKRVYTFYVAEMDTVINIQCNSVSEYWATVTEGEVVAQGYYKLKEGDTIQIKWDVHTTDIGATLSVANTVIGQASFNPRHIDTVSASTTLDFSSDSVLYLMVDQKEGKQNMVLYTENSQIDFYNVKTNVKLMSIPSDSEFNAFWLSNDYLVRAESKTGSVAEIKVVYQHDSIYEIKAENTFPSDELFSIVRYKQMYNAQEKYITDSSASNFIYANSTKFSLSGELIHLSHYDLFWVNTSGQTFTWYADTIAYPKGYDYSTADTIFTGPGCYELAYVKHPNKTLIHYYYEVKTDARVTMESIGGLAFHSTAAAPVYSKAGDILQFAISGNQIRITETPLTDEEQLLLNAPSDTLRIIASDTTIQFTKAASTHLIVSSAVPGRLVGKLVADDGQEVLISPGYPYDYYLSQIMDTDDFSITIKNQALRNLKLTLSFNPYGKGNTEESAIEVNLGEISYEISKVNSTRYYYFEAPKDGEYYYTLTPLSGGYQQGGAFSLKKGEIASFAESHLIEGAYALKLAEKRNESLILGATYGRNTLGCDMDTLLGYDVLYQIKAKHTGFIHLSNTAMILDGNREKYYLYTTSNSSFSFTGIPVVEDSIYFIRFQDQNSRIANYGYWELKPASLHSTIETAYEITPGKHSMYMATENDIYADASLKVFKYTPEQSGYFSVFGSVLFQLESENGIRPALITSKGYKTYKCTKGTAIYIKMSTKYVIGDQWELQFHDTPQPDLSERLITFGENTMPDQIDAYERYIIAQEEGYCFIDSVFKTFFGIVYGQSLYNGKHMQKVSVGDTVVVRMSKEFTHNGTYEIGFISYENKPFAGISHQGTDTVMIGDENFFRSEANDAYSYRWDLDGDGVSDAGSYLCTYTYNQEGEYTVRLVTDNCEGTDTAYKTIVVVNECYGYEISLGDDQTVQFGSTISLMASEYSVWSTGHRGTTLAITNDHEDGGQLEIWAEVDNGTCYTKDTVTITLEAKPEETNLSAALKVPAFGYPTVVRDVLYVETEGEVADISLTDVSGFTVYSAENVTNKKAIPVSDYAPGMYVLVIRSSGGMQAQNIIIE